MEREKQHPTLPYGVSPVVRSFLVDCIRNDVVSVLDAASIKAKNFIPTRYRNIIGVYYGSEATSYELAKIYNISRKRINQLIKEGMLKMWTALPEGVQNKYEQSEIVKLKSGHSPKAIEKMIKARQGKPNPLKGTTHTEEQNGINRQRSKELWEDPEYRQKTLKGMEEHLREKVIARKIVKQEKERKIRGIEVDEAKELVKKYGEYSRNGMVLPKAVVYDVVNKFLTEKKKEMTLVTIDDVCRHLQHLGIDFEPRQLFKIVNDLG